MLKYLKTGLFPTIGWTEWKKIDHLIYRTHTVSARNFHPLTNIGNFWVILTRNTIALHNTNKNNRLHPCLSPRQRPHLRKESSSSNKLNCSHSKTPKGYLIKFNKRVLLLMFTLILCSSHKMTQSDNSFGGLL